MNCALVLAVEGTTKLRSVAGGYAYDMQRYAGEDMQAARVPSLATRPRAEASTITYEATRNGLAGINRAHDA